ALEEPPGRLPRLHQSPVEVEDDGAGGHLAAPRAPSCCAVFISSCGATPLALRPAHLDSTRAPRPRIWQISPGHSFLSPVANASTSGSRVQSCHRGLRPL